jgi:hypothetical protein
LFAKLVQGSANQRGPLEWNALLSGSLVGNSNGENRQGTPFVCPSSLEEWRCDCNRFTIRFCFECCDPENCSRFSCIAETRAASTESRKCATHELLLPSLRYSARDGLGMRGRAILIRDDILGSRTVSPFTPRTPLPETGRAGGWFLERGGLSYGLGFASWEVLSGSLVRGTFFRCSHVCQNVDGADEDPYSDKGPHSGERGYEGVIHILANVATRTGSTFWRMWLRRGWGCPLATISLYNPGSLYNDPSFRV